MDAPNEEVPLENEDGIDQEAIDKAERIEKERKELLNNVLSGRLKREADKVAYVLNSYPEARNSDIDLAWIYWTIFKRGEFDGRSINLVQLRNFPRINSLTRARATIQNTYKLFQADEAVRKFRGVLEEDKRAEVNEERPLDLPTFSVYIDETGKNQQYLSVGSLWVIDGGRSILTTRDEIDDWKEKQKIEYEFHFTEVSRHKVQAFKDFFLKFMQLNPTIGFKIIIINNAGFPDKNQAITDLTFHLVNKGIAHEHGTGRAPLPRRLQIWLDEEEKGIDKLKLENLRERLSGQKIEGLKLGNFEALSSKDNYYIQAVDMFTAAVNRKLHSANGTSHKDELADYILGLLQFDVNKLDSDNTEIDKSTVFNLSYNI